MRTLNSSKKGREKARGDVATIPARGGVHCQVSADTEINFEMVVTDVIFKATMTRPTFCTLSTGTGDVRRALLLFD